MAIVSFTDNNQSQIGKSLSIVSLATYMAIEHNFKILVLTTAYKDKTIERAFFQEETKRLKNYGLFGPNTNVYMGNGLEGLATIMRANKLTPDLITNYTNVVYKDNRLEIIKTYTGAYPGYQELCGNFIDIINAANKHYDLVLVDLENTIGQENYNGILEASTLIVNVIKQGNIALEEFKEFREKNPIFLSPKCLLLIGRYDGYSKYSVKNITRFLKEKNKVSAMPYNTLFFEATEEAKVPDLFLNLRKLKDPEDRNFVFLEETKKFSENIIYRLQDLQMKR